MLLNRLAFLLSLVSLVIGQHDNITYLPYNEKVLDGVEVSFIFPRDNETYAPTLYFPIVMALRNPTDTWPLGLRFIMTIKPQDEQAPPPVDGFIMYPRHGYTSGSSPTSSSFFFAINGTELIHKYSPGWFTILGYFEVEHTCIDVQPGLGIREYSYFSDPFKVNFAVSDGAPLPDIEAAVNLCPNHTAWLKPYGVQKYTNCFLRNITADLPPVSDPCLVKPFANELAADVSRTMLDLMGCPDGDWRTIKEPCPPMETKRSGVPRKEPGLVSLLAAAVISAWVVL